MHIKPNNPPANDNALPPREIQIIDALLTEDDVLRQPLEELALYGYRSAGSLKYGYLSDIEREIK